VKEIKVEVDGELGMGPTGTCIRENRAVVNDDFATNPATFPWRERAQRYGFRASAAFPLRRQGRAVGALTLYATQPGAFDREQVNLLEALSADVSYALDAMEQEKLRTKAEEQLRQTRDYLEHLLDYANAPIIVWAPDLTITRFNHAFERLTGRAASEVIGQRLEVLFPEDQRSASMEKIMRTLEGEFWELIEIPILHRTGRVRHLLWNSANIVGADGRGVVATIAQGTDITERRRAEAALKELNESLEQRVAQRTAESRRLSEQLRALAAELTLTEQRERRRLAAILHDHLQQLLAAAKFRLMPLKSNQDERVQADVLGVEELLNQSMRASRSLMAELSPAVLRAPDFTGAVEWLASWMQENQGLAVNVDVMGEISLEREDVRILLFETIRELLFNVAKHSGVKTAAVRLARSDNALEVMVSDDGAGFDPAELRPGGGFSEGFGLFSIRERLDYLGGRMEISSLPGRGSRVILTVPIWGAQTG